MCSAAALKDRRPFLRLVANNNDTLRDVALAHGRCTAEKLLLWNREVHPGITLTARLMAGTQLLTAIKVADEPSTESESDEEEWTVSAEREDQQRRDLCQQLERCKYQIGHRISQLPLTQLRALVKDVLRELQCSAASAPAQPSRDNTTMPPIQIGGACKVRWGSTVHTADWYDAVIETVAISGAGQVSSIQVGFCSEPGAFHILRRSEFANRLRLPAGHGSTTTSPSPSASASASPQTSPCATRSASSRAIPRSAMIPSSASSTRPNAAHAARTHAVEVPPAGQTTQRATKRQRQHQQPHQSSSRGSGSAGGKSAHKVEKHVCSCR